MTKNKNWKLIFCLFTVIFCVLLGIGFVLKTTTASAAGADYTTKTFSSAPNAITVDDEKYVYKISCFNPRPYVDPDDFQEYVTSISFKATSGCQIYFVDGVACNREDCYDGDYAWNKYSNYYDIVYYDSVNKFIYIRFKNLASLDADKTVNAELADLTFIYKKTTYNPAPQRIHYDIFAPKGYVYNTSGTKINTYYYNDSFYYKATDAETGVSYIQYKKPGSTTWSTYTNGTTIAKTSNNGVYMFRAVDRQGNASSETSIYLDSVLPIGGVYGDGVLVENGGTTTAKSLIYSVSDSVGVVLVYVKKPGSSSYVACEKGATFYDSGEYSFYCMDYAANQSQIYTVLMDHDPPVLTCDAGAFGDVVSTGFNVRVTDTISSKCTIYYKFASSGSYVASVADSVYIPINFSDGKYYFYAVDEYGNSSEVYWIELKVELPTVNIVHSFDSNKVYAMWADGDVIAVLDGTPYIKGTWITEEGIHTLIVTHTKTMRNNSYTFSIDHYYEVKEIIFPTCTEQGYTVYKCISCDDYIYGDYVSAKGHSYQAVVCLPTCTAQGYTIYTCSVCNYAYVSNLVPAKGHDYKQEVTEPTCTTEGYTVNTCNACGYNYRSNYVSSLGHNYLSVSFTATCTEKGGTYYQCQRCENEYTLYTENALGHHYYEECIEPTCVTDGYIEHICTECDYRYKSDEQSAFGHTRITWVSEIATCHKEGKRVHQCETCGNTYLTRIPCLEHKFVVTDSEANGSVLRHYDCYECGYSYTEDKGNQYEMVTSYVEYLYEEYSPYMIWVFLSTAGVWSIVMGIAFIIAYRNEDKVKAKQMLKNYLIGLIVIFGILVAMPYLVNGIAYLIVH